MQREHAQVARLHAQHADTSQEVLREEREMHHAEPRLSAAKAAEEAESSPREQEETFYEQLIQAEREHFERQVLEMKQLFAGRSEDPEHSFQAEKEAMVLPERSARHPAHPSQPRAAQSFVAGALGIRPAQWRHPWQQHQQQEFGQQLRLT